ncbi:MAG: zinc-binding dehydrogenase [Caldimonas sp.]
MKAIVVEGSGLRLATDLPEPCPGPEQLKVRIHAAGVNFADLMRKPSHFGSGASAGPAVAGLEFAGTVEQIGRDVRGFAPGDRVMAMDGGGYAEAAVVDHRLVARVPERLGWPEAAAVMVSFMTAHDALCTQGRFAAGDSVLVQGCTSGVGIAAAQLARHLHASAVIGTSTTAAKLAAMPDWGVDVLVNVREQSVVEAVQRETGGAGVAVIVDAVGGAAAADNLAAAAIGGRWITVGRVDGKSASIELNEFARKRLELIGVTFRTRSLFERIEVVERFAKGVLRALASGAIRPKIDRVFDLAEAAAAQDHVRNGRHFGKVVLQVLS